MTNSIKLNRQGSILGTMPLVLVIMIVVGAFMIDYGNFQVEKSRIQNAADSAAVAAAMRLGNGINAESISEAQAYASSYANMNQKNMGDVLKADEIVLGKWDFKTESFAKTSNSRIANAIRLTVRRGTEGNDGISNYFMSFFGLPPSRASMTATAVIAASSAADVVPVALRDPGFSYISSETRYSEIPSRPRNHVRFELGQEVSIMMYGNNTPVAHLTLAYGNNGANADSEEVKNILSGEDDPVEMQVGDMVPVFDQGGGNGEYGFELEKRLDYPVGSEERTIILPIAEQVLNTRNFRSQIVGDVRISDFVAIKLTRKVTQSFYDARFNRYVSVYVLKGVVVKRRSNSAWGGGTPSGVGGSTATVIELVE